MILQTRWPLVSVGFILTQKVAHLFGGEKVGNHDEALLLVVP